MQSNRQSQENGCLSRSSKFLLSSDIRFDHKCSLVGGLNVGRQRGDGHIHFRVDGAASGNEREELRLVVDRKCQAGDERRQDLSQEANQARNTYSRNDCIRRLEAAMEDAKARASPQPIAPPSCAAKALACASKSARRISRSRALRKRPGRTSRCGAGEGR